MWPGPVANPASLEPLGQTQLPSQSPWCYVARPCCYPSLLGAMWPGRVAIPASLVPYGYALLPSQPPCCHVARPCCHPSRPWCNVAGHCSPTSQLGARWPDHVAIPASLVPCGQALLPPQPPRCHWAKPCCHHSYPCAMWLGTVAIQAALLPSRPPCCHVARPCCHPSLPGVLWPGPVAIPATLVPCGRAL